MKRVISLGGIFFKSEDPAALRAWYTKHLGIKAEDWGAMFPWKTPDEESGEAYTVWSPFKKDTTYFAPSEKPFMMNFVVHDLDGLLEALKSEGVEIVGQKEESEFGKFGWILDPEGNKLELWEAPKKGGGS